MEGGKLLASGTYGCIFDKPLTCKGKPQRISKKFIAKVTESIDAETELKIAALLRKAPLWKNYFILAKPESCAPKPVKDQKDEDVDDCKVLQEVPIQYMSQIYMPWGGKSLHELSMGPNKFHLVEFMKSMLEAVGTMTLQGVCHYDLHPGNIVVDTMGVARIIDFGMAFYGPTISKETVQMRWKILRFGTPDKQEHWISNQEPPEITIINAVIQEKYAIEDATRKTVYNKDIFKQMSKPFLGIPMESNVEEFIAFWDSSKACKQKDWVGFFRLYWPVFDSWALGTIFYNYLIRQLSLKTFADSAVWTEQQVPIQTALRGLLEVNPRKRLDAIEALAILDPGNLWLQRFGTTWLDARKKQREKIDDA